MSDCIEEISCDSCRRAAEICYSPARIHAFESTENTIVAHKGKLISCAGLDPLVKKCRLCSNSIQISVYIKDGKYCIWPESGNITVIKCSIKKPLRQIDVLIIDTEIGLFVKPRLINAKLLFLRGIKISYNPGNLVSTIYSSPDKIGESSKANLMHSIFTAFINDEEDDVYLIDGNGNPLKYETLWFAETDTMPKKIRKCEVKYSKDNWRIYANDKTRVKVYGDFERTEILADVAPVGKSQCIIS